MTDTPYVAVKDTATTAAPDWEAVNVLLKVVHQTVNLPKLSDISADALAQLEIINLGCRQRNKERATAAAKVIADAKAKAAEAAATAAAEEAAAEEKQKQAAAAAAATAAKTAAAAAKTTPVAGAA